VATALLATGMIVAAPAASAADATVTGTVVDNNGAAATGGRVMLFEPEPGVAPAFGDIAADGTFSVSAPAGPYFIVALPPDGSALAAGAPVDVADSTQTAGTYALGSPLTFSVATIAGTVTDADDLPIEGAWVFAMDASSMGGGGGGGGGDGQQGDGGDGQQGDGGDGQQGDGGDGQQSQSAEGAKGDDGSASTSGGGGGDEEGGPEYFALSDANGAYKLGPPAGMWIVMSYNPNTDEMTAPGMDSMATVTAASATTPETMNINFPEPNVSGTVLDPNGDPYAGAFVMAFMCDEMGLAMTADNPNGPECWFAGEGGFGSTTADGSFIMAVPNEGFYNLEIEPKDGDTSVVRYSEVFELAAAGDAKTTWGSPASATITLSAPNVVGAARHPTLDTDGDGVTDGLDDAWVMAIPAVDRGDGTYEGNWALGASAMGPTTRDGTGTFTMSLAEGIYMFEMEPPWRNSSGMMRSKTLVTIGSGVNEVEIFIGVPNVAGTFVNGEGDPIQWGFVMLCEAGSTDCWRNTPVDSDGMQIQGNIDDNGSVGVSIHPYSGGEEVMGGSYSLMLEPDPFQNQGSSKVYVDITMNSTNTGLASASVGGTSVLNSDGTITVAAGVPNLTGTVVDSAGTPVGSSRNTWIGVCAHNNLTHQHVGCSGADLNGNFGISLPASGTWNVNVNPPWDSTTYSMKRYTVITDSSEAITSCVDANGVACTMSGTSFLLALGSPNVLGTVTGYEGRVDAHLEAMVGQDPDDDGDIDWYDWSTGTHLGASGFALQLDDGSYKLKANPGWGMSGVSAAEAFITVASGSVTAATQNGQSILSGGAIGMTWGTPNFSGTVMAGSSAAAEAHVEIKIGQDEDSDGNIDWYRWEDWANANSSGEFGVSLASAGTYQIEARPGWGTTGYASSSYTVVTTSADSTISVASVTDPYGQAVTAESDGSYVLGLATPNFSGIVVKSDASAAFDAHIDVMQQVDSNSDGQWDYYEWVNSDHAKPVTVGDVTTANFAMNISSAGTYELEVWPSWTDTESVRRRVSITATSGDSGISVSCNVAGACVTAQDGTTTITLGSSNISGLVTASDGSTLVSWSGVDALANTDNDDGGTTGEQIGGTGAGYEDFIDWFNIGETAADATTNFRGYLDDGTYLMKAFPSWTDQDSQRTSFTVTVAGSGATITCTSPCTATNNVLAIQLSAGNLSGTITSSASGGLANSIVFLYNDSDGNGNASANLGTDELVRESVTTASGAYSLLVDSGECSSGQGSCVIKVQPPPNADGSATTDAVSISSSVTVNNTDDTQILNLTMTAN